MSLLVLHGPNLKLLGLREPRTHGALMRTQIEEDIARIAADAAAILQSLRSKHEGALSDRIHSARGAICGPGADSCRLAVRRLLSLHTTAVT